MFPDLPDAGKGLLAIERVSLLDGNPRLAMMNMPSFAHISPCG